MDFIIYIIGAILALAFAYNLCETDADIKATVKEDNNIIIALFILMPMLSWIGLMIMILSVDNDSNF